MLLPFILVAFVAITFGADQFLCSTDIILERAINHRIKDVKIECEQTKSNGLCDEIDQVRNSWRDFEAIQARYKDLKSECLALRGLSKRSTDDESINEDEEMTSRAAYAPPPPYVRSRRTIACADAAEIELSRLRSVFSTHCHGTNVCLPDEDIPASNSKLRDDIKNVLERRATKYAEYIGHVSYCNV